MKHLLILVSLLGFCSYLHSQSLDNVWTKAYDHRQNPDDWFGLNDGVATSDGNFILIGCYQSMGYNYGQMHIMKVDPQGDTVWTEDLGSPLTHDVGIDVIETSDNSLMALGIVQFDGNFGRIRLNKLALDGAVLWEKTFLAETEYAWAKGVAETSDGGFMITGVCEDDMFVLKTSPAGDSLWITFVGGDFYDAGDGIVSTSDGGAIAVGCLSTASVKNDSLLIVRVGSDGGVVWRKTLPFNGGQNFFGRVNIYRSADGYFVVNAAAEAGPIYSYELDGNGVVSWQSTLDMSELVATFNICKGSSNATYFTGEIGTDAHTLVGKIDAGGDSLYLTGLTLPESSIGNFIYQDEGNYVYIGGRLDGSHILYLSMWQESPSTDITSDENASPLSYELAQNRPNPFNPETRIEFSISSRAHVSIEVFNLLGQRVTTLMDEIRPAGGYQVIWHGDDSNGSPVATGIYLYRFRAGDLTETRKMILLR